MQVKIYRNFLSKEECEVLNDVAKNGLGVWLGKGKTMIGDYTEKRLTSRSYMNNYEYPQVVIDMSNRIRNFVGINHFPLIEGHGKNGVVVSYTMQNGSVFKHKDQRSNNGLPTYRCNVLTQANEDGCDLYVGDKKIDVKVGDLHCYMVSELPHYVTEAKGETPRIMWMFGAHIPKEYWSEYGLSGSNS